MKKAIPVLLFALSAVAFLLLSLASHSHHVAAAHDTARQTVAIGASLSEQKAANLRTNPHVVLTTGCNHWDSGLDVVVEGDAVRVTDDAVLTRLAEAWATKWDGRFRFMVRDGCFRHEQDEGLPAVLVFSVTPTQILAFTRGALGGHTTHRF